MLENLNKEQLEAVLCVDKNLCIIAGAGSGKTRVITTRIANLINQHQIKDYRILAITFTNKAANEMKARLNKLVPNSNINAMTIHALCVRILREEIKYLNYTTNFTILDNDDQKRILNYIIKDKKIDLSYYKISEIIQYISNNKVENVSTSEAYKYAKTDRSKLFAFIYEKYEKRLQQLQSLDFNDLLLFARKVLMIPEVQIKWQRRYSFIHVDEFQDVDSIQFDIIKLLVNSNTNLCVVGDPDQCIYTWRGAKMEFILDFEKTFNNSKTIVLHQNYRSTPEILNAANSLISNNAKRVKKDLTTSNQKGNKVYHFSGNNENEENAFVIEKIKSLIQSNIPLKEIAILYRSNFSSRSIEKALVDVKIPYKIQGSVRFFERSEIKDTLCYLKLLVDSPAIDLAFDRIINVPRRGIGAKTVAGIREIAIAEKTTMYNVIKYRNVNTGKIKKSLDQFVDMIEKYRSKTKKMPLHKLIGALLAESGYYAMLQDESEEDRIQNIKALIQDIEQFELNTNDATIESYLQEVALYSETETNENSGVSLMSIHTAKGSEYDYVFIYNLSEGIFPSEKSIQESDLEEERRIAYVAMTRARKELYLCESKGFNLTRDKIKTTSRFIKEIDNRYIVQVGKPLNKTLQISNNKQSIKKGDKIVHSIFGEGIVLSLEKENAMIAFKMPHGIKKLLASHPAIKKR